MGSGGTSKNVHVIACGVLALDIQEIVRRLGIEVTFDFLPGGLHAHPLELKRRVQRQIDVVSAATPADRIVLGYGICGMGTVGISARNVPLAIPRVNDCIALVLGVGCGLSPRSSAAIPERITSRPAGWRRRPSRNHRRQTHPVRAGLLHLRAIDGQVRPGERRSHPPLSQQLAAKLPAGRSDRHGRGRRRSKYAAIAQAWPTEFGWKYEEIAGSHDLLTKLLTAHHSTDEVLLVPPHHVTAYDAVARTLKAVPVWEADRPPAAGTTRWSVKRMAAPGPSGKAPIRLGLGIDAGGTYTDVAIYDFQHRRCCRRPSR